jgi:hypothetical protein
LEPSFKASRGADFFLGKWYSLMGFKGICVFLPGAVSLSWYWGGTKITSNVNYHNKYLTGGETEYV